MLANYLTCFSSNRQAQGKILKLAKSLRDSKDALPPLMYSIELYGEENLNALKQLVVRLKNRILDVLSSDIVNSNEENSNDEADVALIRLRRKCTHYQLLLHTKPEIRLKDDLLEEIIALAKEYEDYSILIHHLHMKKWQCQIRSEKKQYEKIKMQIEQYEKVRIAVITACDYIYELKEIEETSGKRNKNKIESFFNKAIPHLQYLYTKTLSTYVLYYLRSLEISRLLFTEKFRMAENKTRKLLTIIKKNKSIYKKQRLGIAYDILAICELNMGNFSKALAHSRVSVKNFPVGHYNYAISKQYEFYSLFYGKLYVEAAKCVTELMRHVNQRSVGDFRFEKFNFMRACSKFMLGNFTEVLSIISFKAKIKADKEGWEFSRRLLEILTNLELGKADQASSLISSLYHFMHDNKNSALFSSRQKIITRTLFQFEKQGFDFSSLPSKIYAMLEKLEGIDKEYGWQVLSSELIPFHKWMLEKMLPKKNYAARHLITVEQ